MARAVSVTERVPLELVGPCMLGIISASLGAGLVVQSGPDRITRGNLYICLSAESGSGKSETFRHCARPFLTYEQEMIEAWQRNEKPGLLADMEIAQAALDSLKKQLKSDQCNRQALRPGLSSAHLTLAEIVRQLVGPSLSCEDVSTEMLAVKMAANGEQLASLSPDARGVADNILGRYSKGATDEAIYLKAFSGDQHRVDRLSRSPITLESPCLTALWLVQPDKLELLLGNQSLSDGGLLPRFLVAHSHAEPQEIDGTARPISEKNSDRWNCLVRELLDTYRHAQTPAVVRAESYAQELLDGFTNEIVRRRRAGGDLADVAIYASRWAEQAWRVAACLHAAHHGAQAASEELDGDIALRALEIVRWFAGQQLDILSAGRDKVKEEKRDKVLLLLADHPTGIKVRDVQLKRIGKDAETCRALLGEMEAAGMIVGRDVTPEGGGHPTRIYTRR
ncbi:MAG: DUF3987 domain-containing protein [Verrucomicrobiota bacterium]